MCGGNKPDYIVSLCFVQVLLSCSFDFLAVLPLSSLRSRDLLWDPAQTLKQATGISLENSLAPHPRSRWGRPSQLWRTFTCFLSLNFYFAIGVSMNGVTMNPELNRRTLKADELLCHRTGLAIGETVQLPLGLPPHSVLPLLPSSGLCLRPSMLFSFNHWDPRNTSPPGAYPAPAFPNHPCSFKAHPGSVEAHRCQKNEKRFLAPDSGFLGWASPRWQTRRCRTINGRSFLGNRFACYRGLLKSAACLQSILIVKSNF